ncbi:hypothetical protein PR048_014987 [Dryococelus australis]|uniref:Uncharacterized protein n=1 Tax=Dryococelus australis TaxID=614101 RepID=A0ABQ9HFX2_9NEOP|nr:hypothetical protein PR048_014987 [Dryococelus australis]
MEKVRWRSLRKPFDKLHRPVQFPHAKIRERPRRESNPVCFIGRQSPDLNPIEHLWDELDRRVRARQVWPKSITQLMEWLQEEWRRIPVDVLQTLVESMPDWVAAVIAARVCLRYGSLVNIELRRNEQEDGYRAESERVSTDTISRSNMSGEFIPQRSSFSPRVISFHALATRARHRKLAAAPEAQSRATIERLPRIDRAFVILLAIGCSRNIIEAIVLSGPAVGQLAHIPRIPMIPTDLLIRFKRLQFPVKRLDCSPPTKANRVQGPAGSLRIFASGNRAGRCRWLTDLLGDLPFHSALTFRRSSILTSFHSHRLSRPRWRTPYTYEEGNHARRRASWQRGIGQPGPAIGAMTTSLSVHIAKTITKKRLGKTDIDNLLLIGTGLTRLMLVHHSGAGSGAVVSLPLPPPEYQVEYLKIKKKRRELPERANCANTHWFLQDSEDTVVTCGRKDYMKPTRPNTNPRILFGEGQPGCSLDAAEVMQEGKEDYASLGARYAKIEKRKASKATSLQTASIAAVKGATDGRDYGTRCVTDAHSAAPRRNRRPTSPSPLHGTMRSRPPDSYPFWESRECRQRRDLLALQISSRLLEFPISLATTQECSGETGWSLSPPRLITRSLMKAALPSVCERNEVWTTTGDFGTKTSEVFAS